MSVSRKAWTRGATINKDPTRTIFTAAISLGGRLRTTRQVQCVVCGAKFSLAHFTRVDAQPSQPSIAQLLSPPAAKKLEVVVIDLTDT
jgi:hypothetical protein